MAMTMHPALLNQRGKAGGVHVFEKMPIFFFNIASNYETKSLGAYTYIDPVHFLLQTSQEIMLSCLSFSRSEKVIV